MHALPSHPRHPLVAGLVAFLLALLALAAAAPELGTLDFSVGGGDASTPSAAPANPAEATWTTDPLVPPVQVLAGR